MSLRLGKLSLYAIRQAYSLRPDWAARASLARRPAPSPPGASGDCAADPNPSDRANGEPSGSQVPRSTIADDTYLNVLLSLTAAYDCVQRSPPRVGGRRR